MARIAPPTGYSNWNTYIEEQANLSPDQSIEARRLIKRNIKLSQIAAVERKLPLPSYRPRNIYISPDSPGYVPGQTWTAPTLLLENGYRMLTEQDESITIGP